MIIALTGFSCLCTTTLLGTEVTSVKVFTASEIATLANTSTSGGSATAVTGNSDAATFVEDLGTFIKDTVAGNTAALGCDATKLAADFAQRTG
jgi:hypothetical protein